MVGGGIGWTGYHGFYCLIARGQVVYLVSNLIKLQSNVPNTLSGGHDKN